MLLAGATNLPTVNLANAFTVDIRKAATVLNIDDYINSNPALFTGVASNNPAFANNPAYQVAPYKIQVGIIKNIYHGKAKHLAR